MNTQLYILVGSTQNSTTQAGNAVNQVRQMSKESLDVDGVTWMIFGDNYREAYGILGNEGKWNLIPVDVQTLRQGYKHIPTRVRDFVSKHVPGFQAAA